jgi:hypothetical protein
MRNLRNAHRLWASQTGLVNKPRLTYEEWRAAAAFVAVRTQHYAGLRAGDASLLIR